jgi:hypothetical protein
MPSVHFTARTILAVALATIFAERSAAQHCHDDERHFSIDLPKGWQMMPRPELEQINRLIAGRMLSVPVHYDAGLRRTMNRPGSFPYVLIQCMKTPSGASYEELERALAVELGAPLQEAQGKVGDIVREMQVGQPVLDRKTNRVIMHTESNVNGVGAAKGLTIGHLGKNDIVFVHSYAKAEDFDSSFPTFTYINDWLYFDKGFEFKPDTGSARSLSWWSVGGSGVIGAVVGLAVGLGGLLFRLMSQPGSKASSKRGAVKDNLEKFDHEFNASAKPGAIKDDLEKFDHESNASSKRGAVKDDLEAFDPESNANSKRGAVKDNIEAFDRKLNASARPRAIKEDLEEFDSKFR